MWPDHRLLAMPYKILLQVLVAIYRPWPSNPRNIPTPLKTNILEGLPCPLLFYIAVFHFKHSWLLQLIKQILLKLAQFYYASILLLPSYYSCNFVGKSTHLWYTTLQLVVDVLDYCPKCFDWHSFHIFHKIAGRPGFKLHTSTTEIY